MQKNALKMFQKSDQNKFRFDLNLFSWTIKGAKYFKYNIYIMSEHFNN